MAMSSDSRVSILGHPHRDMGTIADILAKFEGLAAHVGNRCSTNVLGWLDYRLHPALDFVLDMTTLHAAKTPVPDPQFKDYWTWPD